MAEIARVYGKADDFDIEFTKAGDRWAVEVPPDLSDGRYVVRITAVDILGNTCYWIGELYMLNSVCHMSIRRHRTGCFFSAERYRMKTSVPNSLRLSVRKYDTEFRRNLCMLFRVEERKQYELRFSVDGGMRFSKTADTDFSAKRISVERDEKKILMRRCSALSIGKECSHVR